MIFTASVSASIDLAHFKSGKLVGSDSTYFIDESTELKLTDLPEKNNESWLVPSKDTLALGYSTAVVWLDIPLSNSGEYADWFLEVAYPVLDKVDIYVQYQERTDIYQLGDLVNFSNRPIQHRNFVIPISLETNASARVLLRVQSGTSLQVPIKLWQHTDFYDQEQVNLLWQGIYFGFILVMTFYNLCLYYYSRETKYIFYSFFFGSFVLFQATISGLSYQFLWPLSPTWNDHALPIFLGFVLFSESIFIRSFLELKQRSPKVSIFYLVSILLSALLIVLSSMLPYQVSILCLIVLALPINFIALVVGIRQWLNGNKAAQLFTIAWMGTLFGAIILALSKLGVIERNAFNENALQIGTTISVLWLSFALGENIAQQNRERQKAKEDALEYALKISKERQEKLSAQAEAISAQKQANENLELEVKERTKQLQQAMKDLEQANSKLKLISNLDELTNLYNRRYFNSRFEAEFKRAQRMERILSVIIIDIDHFKMINDEYGHLVGDACLKSVANVLKKCVTRPQDTVSRFGGEEFTILLPDTSREGVLHVAERILNAVSNEKVNFEGLSLNMTVSIGIVFKMPTRTDQAEDLLEKADMALYKAKHAGRNCIVEASV
jgi:diguanylate cyclase